MEEFKKFCGFVEFLFFTFGFGIFLLGLFLRNDYLPGLSKLILNFITLPFILVAIVYGFLSLRNFILKERGDSTVVDGSLFLVGLSIFIFVFFIFIIYPNKI